MPVSCNYALRHVMREKERDHGRAAVCLMMMMMVMMMMMMTKMMMMMMMVMMGARFPTIKLDNRFL